MKLIGAAILEFGQQHSPHGFLQNSCNTGNNRTMSFDIPTVLGGQVHRACVCDVLPFEADRGSNTGVISFCPIALYTGFSVELFRDLKHRRLSFDNPTVLFSTMSNR